MQNSNLEDQHYDELTTRGFIEINNIIPNDLLARVQNLIEIPLQRPMLNGQKGYIKKDNIRYLFGTLSWGREIIDLYTIPYIIKLTERYIDDRVHLSNYRIYRTFPSRFEKMRWHVDNKEDSYDPASNKFETRMALHDKGLIMIIYLSDVEDGGFQIVEGSHLWSNQQDREHWDSDIGKYEDKIVTFNHRKAGTILLYDYRCIHRAKPYQGGAIRTSLFGQYSPSFMPIGEPILLTSGHLKDLTEQQKKVLNFGVPPSSENWPIGLPGELYLEIGPVELMKSLALGAGKKIFKLLNIYPK